MREDGDAGDAGPVAAVAAVAITVSEAAGAARTPGAKMNMRRRAAVWAAGQAGQPQNGRTRLHLARQIPITHI